MPFLSHLHDFSHPTGPNRTVGVMTSAVGVRVRHNRLVRIPFMG